jgi:hypothetical protein
MINSSTIGFYFLIFQSQLNGFLKCWIDGSDSYSFYTQKEILDFASKTENPNLIIPSLKNAFSQTSFFIWNVNENKITRLRSNQQEESIRSFINDKKCTDSSFSRKDLDIKSNSIIFDGQNVTMKIK